MSSSIVELISTDRRGVTERDIDLKKNPMDISVFGFFLLENRLAQ